MIIKNIIEDRHRAVLKTLTLPRSVKLLDQRPVDCVSAVHCSTQQIIDDIFAVNLQYSMTLWFRQAWKSDQSVSSWLFTLLILQMVQIDHQERVGPITPFYLDWRFFWYDDGCWSIFRDKQDGCCWMLNLLQRLNIIVPWGGLSPAPNPEKQENTRSSLKVKQIVYCKT